LVADIIDNDAPTPEETLPRDEITGLPPALSQEELLELAELVVRVEIRKIIWAKDRTSPHLARLYVEKVIKGKPRYRFPRLARLRLSRIIEVKMRRIRRDNAGRKMLGEWSDGYRAGDRVMTHLYWDAESGGYRTLWWNAVWQTPN
jgi:hypothetical protein